jgi:hypothetical protein
MEIIGEQKSWTFPASANKSVTATCTKIRKENAHLVSNYMELATKVAELQFMNRDYVLLYRGQNGDYRNDKGNTTLKPSLFRSSNGRNPNPSTLISRFNVLESAENYLSQQYAVRSLLGRDRLKRQQILRWSILQH